MTTCPIHDSAKKCDEAFHALEYPRMKSIFVTEQFKPENIDKIPCLFVKLKYFVTCLRRSKRCLYSTWEEHEKVITDEGLDTFDIYWNPFLSLVKNNLDYFCERGNIRIMVSILDTLSDLSEDQSERLAAQLVTNFAVYEKFRFMLYSDRPKNSSKLIDDPDVISLLRDIGFRSNKHVWERPKHRWYDSLYRAMVRTNVLLKNQPIVYPIHRAILRRFLSSPASMLSELNVLFKQYEDKESVKPLPYIDMFKLT